MRRLSYIVSTPTCSSSLPLVALLRSPLDHTLLKKYSKHQGDDQKEEHVLDKERAPSTAEIMDELSQEKEDNVRILEEKSQQGFVSHTSDKVLDAATEVVGGDANPEDVKEIYKHGSPAQTYHKPRDDGGVGPTSV